MKHLLSLFLAGVLIACSSGAALAQQSNDGGVKQTTKKAAKETKKAAKTTGKAVKNTSKKVVNKVQENSGSGR
jgi:uncharacterized protein (UPF0333 family)